MMKRISIVLCSLIMLSTAVFAENNIKLHTMPSVRQQGFGGFYTTDLDNFYGIYSNPAILGLHKKHALFPGLDANVAGPLQDISKITQGISSNDMAALSEVIKANNGIKLGLNAMPLLSFGGITAFGFGWSLNTQVYGDATVPGISLANMNAGAEAVLRLGFGFRIINTDNHTLSVGATAKGFAQYGVSVTDTVSNIIKRFQSFDSLPAQFNAGFGFDVGAYYSLCKTLDIAVTWYDCFSPVYSASGTVLKPDFNFKASGNLDPRLAAGLCYHLPVGWTRGVISSFKIMADYRNFYTLWGMTYRNPILELSCGAELVLGNILSLRFGMQEMYPAAGVGLSFGNFKIDAAIYGRELGLEPGSSPCLNASVYIGFTY